MHMKVQTNFYKHLIFPRSLCKKNEIHNVSFSKNISLNQNPNTIFGKHQVFSVNFASSDKSCAYKKLIEKSKEKEQHTKTSTSNGHYSPTFKGLRYKEEYAKRKDAYENSYGKQLRELHPDERIDYLTNLFQNTDKIDECFLIYLHRQKFIENENLKTFAKIFPEKIGKCDQEYLIVNKIPLTPFDDSGVLNQRSICQTVHSCTVKDDEYKENINCILDNEIQHIRKAKSNREMIIVSGLSASGKSSFIEENYDTNDYYLGDIDKIKELFPSYGTHAKSDNSLHNIARYIFQALLLPTILAAGKNVIIPTTGLAEYVERLSKQAKNYGYNVKLLHITIPEDIAIKNSIKRFHETGKFVDPFFVQLRAPFMETLAEEAKKIPQVDEVNVVESQIKEVKL